MESSLTSGSGTEVGAGDGLAAVGGAGAADLGATFGASLGAGEGADAGEPSAACASKSKSTRSRLSKHDAIFASDTAKPRSFFFNSEIEHPIARSLSVSATEGNMEERFSV
jgi:hypothetical protein